MNNPLLADWDTPFRIAPFQTFSDDDFAPALEVALGRHNSEIAAIAAQQDAVSFETVIGALERAGKDLEKVLSVFYTVSSADSTAAREALQREFAPKLAAHFSQITANKALFARIEALWTVRDTQDLTPEQQRVLMLTRRGFLRAGAALTGAQDVRMGEIKSRLAQLGTSFTQNLLADERDWFMPLGDGDLAGLPQFVIDAACAAGAEKGQPGPVVTLSRSLIVPFLEFSSRRDLRRKAFEAWSARGANGGATDNRAICAEILALRQERAALLGYESFAAYKLETEMAGTPEAVHQLLRDVWGPAKAQAEADAKVLTAMLKDDGINEPLAPWDWRYYAARRREAEHNLNEAELKPYFQLDKMIEASFACANRLFGLDFAPLDVALYHPDCRAWNVTRDGKHVAVFIGDYFARGSKRSGAWCSAMRAQAGYPQAQSPVVINVCNFAKATPALLSYDDARTLFHEFGHALHQMLSNVTYESVSGTSVARDFVELPSQLFEHWLTVPAILTEFAIHCETGAPMPAPLLEKLLGAAHFDMGFQTVEYLASAMVDLAFHEGAAPQDPMARQAEVLAQIGLPAAIAMRHATPQFAHVFSGDGYAAGYYSYMWSEVMDADAFAAFEDCGDVFDPALAASLERNILSRGGAEEPSELYVAFRGRMPGVEALLRGRGLGT
ncbi:M3 family metallopeptidase [uncultured Lentibacter sp.]|uniref:M3 family metallopeptidase n=1 Tax=uncultured Lentibacter sp. TaxID=1659309 RepID=UPI00262BD5EF|nr:M3 family metallopeptidase [uncultured Lentibacter sp.]